MLPLFGSLSMHSVSLLIEIVPSLSPSLSLTALSAAPSPATKASSDLRPSFVIVNH